jgi:hypothetical protein
MPLVTRISTLTQYVVDRVELNKASLGLGAVFYGDQNKIAVTPTVCIEPEDKVRELAGVPRKTLVTVNLFLIVYLNAIQSPTINRSEADKLIEDLEDFLHADNTMNDTVIHSMVTRIESGYAMKGNTVLRASRLSYNITTQELLG